MDKHKLVIDAYNLIKGQSARKFADADLDNFDAVEVDDLPLNHSIKATLAEYVAQVAESSSEIEIVRMLKNKDSKGSYVYPEYDINHSEFVDLVSDVWLMVRSYDG